MAGPRATLLFPEPLTEHEQRTISSYLKRRADRFEDEYFWINERPFAMGAAANPVPRDYDDEELVAEIEFKPRAILSFHALNHTRVDHLLIGEISQYIANEFDAWIDFHGLLELPPFRIVGHLAQLNAGTTRTYHVCDARFLRAYMKNDAFQLPGT